MRSFVVAVLLLVPAIAAAQPGAPADAYLAKLLRAGQIAAEQGKCEIADTIGARVAELDAEYHARVYRADAIIATCMEGIDRRPRPPGSLDPAITEPLPPGPERPTGVPGEKSEGTALALSLGGTIASYALVLAASHSSDGGGDAEEALGTIGGLGAWFAPSFGHWYAGKYATRGLGMRAAAAGLGLTALIWLFSECPLFGGECDHSIGPGVLLVGAGGLWIAGTIDDISHAPDAVRAYNKSLPRGLSIVPVVREDGVSAAVAGTF